MGHKKAYIVHLGMSSLYAPGVGQACVSESMAESRKPECGHAAVGKR